MLFNEPKLLKYHQSPTPPALRGYFSALQRAEIAEMQCARATGEIYDDFSALQRAEIAEIEGVDAFRRRSDDFSALQRAEIAEIWCVTGG